MRTFVYSPPMTRTLGAILARQLAIWATIVQVLLPAAVAQAGTSGDQGLRLLCAPSGAVSAETLAAAEQLASLLEDRTPQDGAGSDDHCALCTPAHAEPPAAQTLAVSPVQFTSQVIHPPGAPQWVRPAQGPPLGSRAPPAHG